MLKLTKTNRDPNSELVSRSGDVHFSQHRRIQHSNKKVPDFGLKYLLLVMRVDIKYAACSVQVEQSLQRE